MLNCVPLVAECAQTDQKLETPGAGSIASGGRNREIVCLQVGQCGNHVL